MESPRGVDVCCMQGARMSSQYHSIFSSAPLVIPSLLLCCDFFSKDVKLRRAGDLSRTKKEVTQPAWPVTLPYYVCACQKETEQSPPSSPHAEVSSRGSFVLCLQDYTGVSRPSQ